MSADLVLKQIKLETKTRKHIKSNLTLSASQMQCFFHLMSFQMTHFVMNPPAPKQFIIKFTHASARGKFILVSARTASLKVLSLQSLLEQKLDVVFSLWERCCPSHVKRTRKSLNTQNSCSQSGKTYT